MSSYDGVADLLFHAAMCIGTTRKNTFMGAIFDAYRYLGDHELHQEKSTAIQLYRQLNGHAGDAWPMIRGPYGGQWIAKHHMQELLMSVLFTYEYVVQELGAARSPADPRLIMIKAVYFWPPL